METGSGLHYLFLKTPWCINPSMANVFTEVARNHWAGLDLKNRQADKSVETDRVKYEVYDQTAIVKMHGVVLKRAVGMESISGFVTHVGIEDTVKALKEEKNIKKVIFDMDSPGGTAIGTPESAEAIASLPMETIAYTSGYMASAMYWLGTACDKIVCSTSAKVGSVGTYMMHVSYQKKLEQDGVKVTFIKEGEFKTSGNKFEDLTEKELKVFQKEVSKLNNQFIKAVSDYRGLDLEHVKNNIATGLLYDSEDALELGLVDYIGSIEHVMESKSNYSFLNPREGNMDLKKATLADLKELRSDLYREVVSSTETACQIEADREHLKLQEEIKELKNKMEHQKTEKKIQALADAMGLEATEEILAKSFEEAATDLMEMKSNEQKGRGAEKEEKLNAFISDSSSPVGEGTDDEEEAGDFYSYVEQVAKRDGLPYLSAHKIASRERPDLYRKQMN